MSQQTDQPKPGHDPTREEPQRPGEPLPPQEQEPERQPGQQDDDDEEDDEEEK